MKKFSWLLALAIPFGMLSCQKDATLSTEAESNELNVPSAVTGNGAPSGAHYTLNLLGSKTAKSENFDMTADNGHRIFVQLGSKTGAPTRTKIMLTPGTDFAVLDADGTDGTAAFQLPNDVATTYKVYARALGGPGGKAVMTTCATGLTIDGYEEVCSIISTPELTAGPKPKFVNVTTELFTITLGEAIYDTEGNVIVEAGETLNIFDDRLEDYFWAYDNNGLKLLQLRFYAIEGMN